MSRDQVLILITSTLIAFATSAIAVGGSLWKIFNVIAQFRLQLLDQRNALTLLEAKTQHQTEMNQAVISQMNQRIDHATNKFNIRLELVENHVKQLENFLTKTTQFETRE